MLVNTLAEAFDNPADLREKARLLARRGGRFIYRQLFGLLAGAGLPEDNILVHRCLEDGALAGIAMYRAAHARRQGRKEVVPGEPPWGFHWSRSGGKLHLRRDEKLIAHAQRFLRWHREGYTPEQIARHCRAHRVKDPRTRKVWETAAILKAIQAGVSLEQNGG